MKAFIHRVNSSPKYAKAFHWGKLITITGSTQIIIQGLGFLCGVIIIRLLPTKDYAWYTLANTMLGTMTILADSGIANGVMAEGGKVWQDKKKLGVVVATGLRLRKRYGIISLLVTAPILAYLLLHHDANWFTTVLIVIAIIPSFYAALSDSLLEVAPKLHQAINPLAKNGVQVSVGRLALTGFILLLFPFAFMMLIANSIPRLYGNYKLKKISDTLADSNEKPDPVIERQVNKSVKRTMPVVIYYCLSGQISIWLLSFFGTTASVSEIGALGRLGIIFNFCTGMFSALVIPRFSRMNAESKVLLRKFLLIQLSTILISVVILFSIWLFSDQILWIFGKNYQHLNYELFLVGLSSCIGLMVGVCSQLVVNRGWYIKPYILIGFNLISTVISIVFFNMTSLVGILYFNIVVVALQYLLMLFFGVIKINGIEKEVI